MKLKMLFTSAAMSAVLALPLQAEVYIADEGSAFSDEIVKEKEYKKGDFVLVKVSEDSEVTVNSSKGGTRDTEVSAKLAKWVRFKTKRDADGSHVRVLKPSATDEPEIDFESDSRFNNTATDEYKSSLKEDMTVQIKDVRPNGNFYVEGRKEIRENGNVRKVIISGVISKEDVMKGGTVLSRQIYNFKVEIKEEGERRKQTERNPLQRFLLYIWPF